MQSSTMLTVYKDAQVKAAAEAYKTPLYSTDATSQPVDVAASTETITNDPTVAHASLSELDTGDIVLTNGHDSVAPVGEAPANASISNGAANAAAEGQWDASNDMSMSISQEWVDVSVPREPAETEPGVAATPATQANTQSWADDQPEAQPTVCRPITVFIYQA
jgi:hypothetical protein